MQKKRQLKTCIVVVVLMCLLTVSMTFQTICVKTISDNYINSLIVNQIIDLIIDEETDANFQQINQLQNKIKKGDALYQLNRYSFDQSMRNTNKNKIKLDQKELQKFSTSCKKMIKDELNISIEEKQIMNILKDELSEIYKDKFLISEDELDEILFDKYEKNLNILCADSLKTDLCEVFSKNLCFYLFDYAINIF